MRHREFRNDGKDNSVYTVCRLIILHALCSWFLSFSLCLIVFTWRGYVWASHRKEMARADATRQEALRRGGREAPSHTHAGTPELQVQAAAQEARETDTRCTVFASLGDQHRGQQVQPCRPSDSSFHVSRYSGPYFPLNEGTCELTAVNWEIPARFKRSADDGVMISTTLTLYLRFSHVWTFWTLVLVENVNISRAIIKQQRIVSVCVIEMRLRSKMDSYQGMSQIPWGGHSPISSLYHQQQQQSIQEYKSENNSLYGSPYTPIIHTPDISPVASPEPDGKFLKPKIDRIWLGMNLFKVLTEKLKYQVFLN